MSRSSHSPESNLSERSLAGALANIDRVSTVSPGYYLGVDGGGTKTHAVLIDSSHQVIGQGSSGAANPLRVGLEQAVSNVKLAAHEACSQAGIEMAQVSSACVALGGVGHPIHFQATKDALDRALGIEHLRLTTDAQAAMAGALDGHAGVVIIAGTGSIAMGINGSGSEARAGGWGPTLGDEGSGYDIAKRALKAVAASFDGRSPSTTLTRRICQRLGISTTADLPGIIYSSWDSQPVQIASLAELVSEEAVAGDEVARGILSEAGRELGKLAVSVIERLGLRSENFRVACVGSVFKAGEQLLQPMREAVRRIAPGAEIGPPLFSPTIGAAKLAGVSR
jgi:N-acetylglucosamine kinase-like BadF-type ATPase